MNGWSSLFGKRRHERELDRELRFHLEQQVRDLVASGLSPDEARRRAALEFGGIEQMKEACRDVRPSAIVEQLLQDLRYAVRQLGRARGFAATAIVTIAVGIGACAALFSIVNGVLLRPLRFTEPERIVQLAETRPPNSQRIQPAPGAFMDWIEQSTAFSHIAAIAGRGFNLRRDGHVVEISAQLVTANFFAVLGIEPILGRKFLPEEETPGKDHVILISYGVWQGQFGGRDDALNQTVLLNDQAYTIIGVLPDRDLIWNAAIFAPLVFTPAAHGDYGSHGGFGCIARLKPGVSLEAAQADLDVVSQHIARAHPESNLGHGATVQRLLDSMTGDVRIQLFVLLAAVGLVLLIACVNVASLLLARANARQREIAVRAALGASRGRIIRQFLVESLLVTMAGGVLGALIAYASLGAIAQFVRPYVPRTNEITMDVRVLTLTLALMLVAGLVVGLLPALQFTRGDLAEPLKDAGRGSSGGRKRQRLRSVLVGIEIALATMLLTGTGLLARSLTAMQRADQGFSSRDVFINRISLGGNKYNSAAKRSAFIDEAIERIGALPDVAAVAFSNGLPMVGSLGLLFQVVGTPAVPVKDMPHTGAFAVTPDYFKALSVPLLRGRNFTPQDRVGAPRVVIINQELARQQFGDRNPLGERLMIMTMADTPDVIREIVGVVGNVKSDGPQSRLTAQVYEPLAQLPQGGLNLVIKAKGPAPALPVAIGEIVKSIDPDLPFRNLRTYDSAVANSWFRQRFSMVLFTVFSGIALLLAAIGIYGVMSYAVSQRTQEIGIRMALGAKARDVVGLVFRNGAQIVVAGLVAGLAGSLLFAQVLRTLLFNTSASDPLNLLAVSGLLAFVAFVACALPARRATKVDPMVALRSE